jgi:hypothetical protein
MTESTKNKHLIELDFKNAFVSLYLMPINFIDVCREYFFDYSMLTLLLLRKR